MSSAFSASPDVDGGASGALLRAIDWSRTPLGSRDRWPQSLRTAVGICLESRFPMNIWWGPELVQIYNDAYRPVLGDKHPRSMGQNGRECWSEIWPVVGPLCDQVIYEGVATWSTDLLLEMDRHGYVEETYFTFSYSPIRDESGGVGGVLITCTETTDQVTTARRLDILRELGAQSARGTTAEDACERVARVLAAHAIDVPFAAIWLLDDATGAYALAGSAGGAAGDPAFPDRLGSDGSGTPWPIVEAVRQRRLVEVHELERRVGELSGGPWPVPAGQAVVLPIGGTGAEPLVGVLVAGVSPRRRLDAPYRDFLSLVAGHVASNVASARAYEAERRRAEALAEIDRAKTAFFGNVSHELRTPLTLQIAPLEDALADREEPLGEVQRERVTIAHRNSLRLLRLVNTLLDFSRIEAGRLDGAFEPTDLAAATAELASSFRSAIERAGLRLEVDCEPLPAPIWVDPDMWEKVVLNLLSNALKHTFRGHVRVAVRPEGDGAIVEIADTGVGIPADQLGQAFERFHRVKGQRSRSHEGTGIGLALVHELVRLHHGTVEVASRVDEGTTFRIRLRGGHAHLPVEQVRTAPSLPRPVGRSDAGEAEWAAEADAAPPSCDLADRVLLVDDNADMRAYLTRILSARWRVEAVADGQAALEAAQREPPGLVLTDVMMPRLDGFELLERLRADPRTATVPVVMLSARAGEESRVEGLDAGADDYLPKPFAARELVARVGAHLEQSRLRRAAADHERQLRLRAESDRAFLRELFARSPALMLLLRGPDHVVELVNDAYADVVGRTPDEMVGRRLLDLLPELEAQGFGALLDGVFRTGVPFVGREVPAKLRRPGQEEPEERWFSFVYQPMHEGREVRGVLVQGVDLTDEVATRKRAEDSERQLRLVTDALPALVAYVGRDLAYRFVNGAYRDWFGVDPESLAGKTPAAVAGDGPFERARPLYERVLAGERVAYETVLETLAGPRTVSVVYTPDRDRDEVRGFVAMVTDITSRVAEEERLRQAQRMEAVGTLAGGVAHEVNNMMTAVIGFGEYVLSRGHPDDRWRPEIGEMVKAGRRAAGVTQQLLAFSRRQVLQSEVLDANAVVGELTRMLGRMLGADVVLDVALGSGVGHVRADRGQLEQVLVNLALNARDAMVGGGRLTVTTERVGSEVCIVVEDDGIGMDEATRCRAFEPFFTTKPVGRGTGLGLSTVYGIVTQSGGRVWLESAPGAGTRVTVRFPSVTGVPSARPSAGHSPAQGTETVLVVEDEELVRHLARRILEDAGFRVVEAENGREGLARMAEDPEIAVVLTDLVMPEMGGRELGRLLASTGDGRPVLYMSGYSGDHLERQGILEKGMRFVQKPFAAEVLVGELRKALDA